MKNILISVIVPIHNVENFISQTIENVINQTYKNLQIILIDDGSTDNSGIICDKYKKIDKRINVIHQENVGLATTRNNGISLAKGEYIHFLDADDYLPLNYYEKMIEALGESHADVICSGFYFEKHPRESVKFNDTFILINTNDKYEKTFVYRFMYVWRYLIKTAFIHENNLSFVNGVFMEDQLFTVEMIYKANMIITAPVQYFYRWNKNSIMNTKNKKSQKLRQKDAKQIQQLLNDFVKQHNIDWKNRILMKKTYKLFGIIPMIKKYDFINKTIYKLCGIKVWECK